MKSIFLVISLFICSCSADDKWLHETRTKYYIDNRTNLCFTTIFIQGSGIFIINIPCTPEVKKIATPLINK